MRIVVRMISVVNSGRSRLYRGTKRQKMNHRVTALQSGTFGERRFRGREMVERVGPKAGQIGRFLHVFVFWRLFPASCRREGHKTSCRREGHKTTVFWWLFPASCRREGEREEKEREYGGIKIDLTVK